MERGCTRAREYASRAWRKVSEWESERERRGGRERRPGKRESERFIRHFFKVMVADRVAYYVYPLICH